MKALPLITSLTNPTVKLARALHQRKHRVDTGLFLVEGLHHIGEVLEAGWEVDWLLYAPELLSSEYGAKLVEGAAGLPTKLQPVSAPVMESLTGKDNPQGLLAIVRQKDSDIQALPDSLPAAALVAPQDPGNVGAILRTLDAVGGGGLLMVDSNLDIYHPSVVRASMGSLFWKPIIQVSFPEFLTWARSQGRQIIGTSARADEDFRSFTAPGSWVLVLGSEQKGLSPEQLAACDRTLSLPMRGRISSLNLAVAAGILLYSLCK